MGMITDESGFVCPLTVPPRRTVTLEDFATPEAAFQSILAFQFSEFGPFDPWALDPGALEDAKTVLNLTWPLEIDFGGPVELGLAALACYRTTQPGILLPSLEEAPIHRLYVRTHEALSHEMASICLWHELAHAQQAEAKGSPKALWEWVSSVTDYEKLQVDPDREKYLNNPVEYPAFAAMRNHFDHFPLTVPA